ncbi:prephenate dehydratase [Oerskovia flava]|uniref:prephenate dehydratase n=1 Tax=Oerskovia flava TaxID=2986422 RepID=UPI00223EDA88|nr:prephenate dehydratase domain-containing protein [Oerskovia sp. JB1-3-2]
MSRVAYLGPEGTFTHQAALRWSRATGAGGHDLVALPTVTEVSAAVSRGDAERGVVAIESTVEGYVVPSLDALLGSADVVAVDETVLDVTFDAFVRPDRTELTEITAHPHGLAQCQEFVRRSGLTPVPAASNAAACRDAAPHQVALGPTICGELYGLETTARAVEDFHGARTRFLTLARRDVARALLPGSRSDGARWRTMLAITPKTTGPGVLARIVHAFGTGGVNLSSLITRPLKAQEGKYVFVLTADAAPWDTTVRAVLEDLLGAGDWVKTLGVFPARGELDDALDAMHVPVGSVDDRTTADLTSGGLLWD